MIDTILGLDTALFQMIYGFSQPWLDPIMIVITHLGSAYLWILLSLALLVKKNKQEGVALFSGLALNTVLIFLLKSLILRPRPFETLEVTPLVTEIDTGFPSGHASTAFVGAGILSRYSPHFSKLLYLLAILVSISRVYVGVHYPLDVIAGAIQGIMVGLFILKLPLKKYLKGFFR